MNLKCKYMCVNTIGSFECYCHDGFNLQVDGVSCIDINECDINNGECEQQCLNEVGSFKCQCYNGFVILDDGLGCNDINECNDSNGNCAHTCVNTNGSFICQCDHGFTLVADGISCIDINECDYNNGGCAHNCLNKEGSFKCQCNEGFEFQTLGHSCVDKNGCDKREDSCTQKCVIEIGTVKCHCDDGFDPQYAGVSCVDINECDTHNGGCAHICLNEEGTYRCECTDGYTLNDDGHSCEDINECEEVADVCGVACLNFHGTYLCSCPLGFSLMDDDRTCRKLVEQTFSSILRLTVDAGITEDSLKNIAEYKRIETNIIQTVTNYITQYTNASFTILVHQISIGSIVVENTVVINNGSSTIKTIGEIFESVMNLSKGDTMLFNGSTVQAKAEIPDNGSELCGIFELLHGSCDDGYRCEILDNKPKCSLVQSKADQNSHSGSYVAYLAPSVVGVALIVMIVLLTSCALVIRKKRQTKTKGRMNLSDLPSSRNKTSVSKIRKT